MPASRNKSLTLLALAAFLAGGPGGAMAAQPEAVSGARDLPLSELALRAGSVSFIPIERERGGSELSFPGIVAVPPSQLRVVAAPVEGLVETVEVAPDELVKPGQTIIRMRSPALVEAQRELIAADADAVLAVDRLRRAEQLFAARAVAERDLRVAENEAKTTSYRAAARRQSLTLMGMTEQEVKILERTREFKPTIDIVAPKAGIVLSRHTSPGARVAAAEPLFTVAQLDPLWVNIQVPSSRLRSLEVGSPVFLPGQGATGHLIRVGRSVDPATQSVTAVAQIDTGGGIVRPGLAVTVRVRVEQNGLAQWVVPSASLVRHRDRSWVFVRSQAGARATPVQVVTENARDASIRVDLKPDDRIADRGLVLLLAELAKADTE